MRLQYRQFGLKRASDEMSTSSPLRNQVVRFYGNFDFALDAIANRQVTFIHVTKLNDQFDPYFFFETDFDVSYTRLVDYVREKHPTDFSWFINMVTPSAIPSFFTRSRRFD
jgi:hypothetical protein